jgi:hypothetical protein
MKHKREIIEALLSGLSSMEEFYDSPDVICRHFSNWIDSVRQILASADMNDELNSWNNDKLFLSYIGDIHFIDNRFAQLEDLRNIVAHHGILPSEDDFQRVFISYRD